MDRSARKLEDRIYEAIVTGRDIDPQALTKRIMAIIANPDDEMIEALIEWTPSPYEIDTEDQKAYAKMFKAAFTEAQQP